MERDAAYNKINEHGQQDRESYDCLVSFAAELAMADVAKARKQCAEAGRTEPLEDFVHLEKYSCSGLRIVAVLSERPPNPLKNNDIFCPANDAWRNMPYQPINSL